MEHFNPYKKILDKQIKKTGEINPVEEYYDNTINEEEDPKDVLEQNLEENQNTAQEIENLLLKNEQHLDMQDELSEVENLEVYYLQCKSKINSLRNKIEDLKMTQTQVDDSRFRKLHKKISLLEERYQELSGEYRYSQRILDTYPKKILDLEKELETFEEFLESYEDQSENYFNN